MNETQAPSKRKPGPGRRRIYHDGTGHGAPTLRVRLAPDVLAALRATGDPRAAIERLVREHPAILEAARHLLAVCDEDAGEEWILPTSTRQVDALAGLRDLVAPTLADGLLLTAPLTW